MGPTFDRYCMYIVIKLYLRNSLFFYEDVIVVVNTILLFYSIYSQFQNTTSVDTFFPSWVWEGFPPPI